MANELIKLTKLLGNYKTILGDGKTDIVLETLGKVYIKTGNNLKLINELFKLIEKFNKFDIEDLKSKVIITDNLEELNYPGDGLLIFDISKKALYIAYDNRYILLLDNIKIDETPEEEPEVEDLGYVKKTGDTMTGLLIIKTTGAPLIVASKKLVKNFNALYLNGYSSSEVAIKKLDEYISGTWTFDNDVYANKNIIVRLKIGTAEFADGYNGYGWRLDSNTNMLTVDYLVVRKAMHVFELIVNRISATNGSFWVTDTCKVKEVFDIHFLDITSVKEKEEIVTDKWYLPKVTNNINTITIEGSHLANSNGSNKGPITYYNYGYILKFNKPYSELGEIDFTNPDIWSDELKKAITVVPLFETNKKETIANNSNTNNIYNPKTTPCFYSTLGKMEFISKDDILIIYLYYKYFGNSKNSLKDIKVITLDDEIYPTIREGDLVRCQKFLDNNIKYYDALVSSRIGEYLFILILAESVFDKYSDEKLTEKVNSDYYSKTNQTDNIDATQEESKKKVEENPETIITGVTEGDGLVRLGSITDTTRLGSMYMTSSEFNSPNLKVLDGIDKPDYTVIYTYPKFSKIEYNGKEHYYTLTTENEGIIINGKWYKLYDIPNINCEIEYTEDPKTKVKTYYSIYSNHIKAQLGKLDGIRKDIFKDKQPKGFGLFGDNVYLTGEFFLNNGLSVVEFTKNLIKLEINSSGIGNNNLVLNSAQFPFEKYKKGEYKDYVVLELSEPIKSDTMYTFQIGSSEIIDGTIITDYSVVIYNTSLNKPMDIFNYKIGNELLYSLFEYSEKDLNIEENVEIRLYNRIYNSNKATTSIVWKKIMLEKSALIKDWKPAPEDAKAWQDRVFEDLEEIKKQADGAIDTWFESKNTVRNAYKDLVEQEDKSTWKEPLLTDWPTKEWKPIENPEKPEETAEKKQVNGYIEHLGDLYYGLDEKAYRFSCNKSVKYADLKPIPEHFFWIEINDTGIIEALKKAQKALDTADGKRRIFVNIPNDPESEYDIGDLWVNATYPDTCTPESEDTNNSDLSKRWYFNQILRCRVPKQKASLQPGDPDYKEGVTDTFSIAHWDLASRYNEALISLKNMADDYIITVQEQVELKKIQKEIEAEKTALINLYANVKNDSGNKEINGQTLSNEVTEALNNYEKSFNELNTVINNVTAVGPDGKPKDYILDKSNRNTADLPYSRVYFLQVFNNYYNNKTILESKINDPIKKWLEASGIKISEGAIRVTANQFEIRDNESGATTAKVLSGGALISKNAYFNNIHVRNGEIKLGDYNNEDDFSVNESDFTVKAGLKSLGTIAAYFGSNLISTEISELALDKEKGENKNGAKSLFRMDGSGYFANGNFKWDNAGNITVNSATFNVGNLEEIKSLAAWADWVKSRVQRVSNISEAVESGVLYIIAE